jgi:hypothetical protein
LNSVAELRAAARVRTAQIVQPGARVGVDHAEGRGLLAQMDENARQHRMLDHIGRAAGVKRVTVVHPRPGKTKGSVCRAAHRRHEQIFLPARAPIDLGAIAELEVFRHADADFAQASTAAGHRHG